MRDWFTLVETVDKYANRGLRKPCVVVSRTETIRADDYPGNMNVGLKAAGLVHLEGHGFKENDKVRVLIIIEKIPPQNPASNEPKIL